MVALTRIVAIRLNSSNRASHPALADPAAHRPVAVIRQHIQGLDVSTGNRYSRSCAI